MSTDFPKEATGAPFKKSYQGWINRLAELEKLGAPDPIKAHAFACFYRAALGYIGPDLGRELFKVQYEDARKYYGICRGCDVEVKDRTNDYCPDCNKQIDEWVDAVNNKMEEVKYENDLSFIKVIMENPETEE